MAEKKRRFRGLVVLVLVVLGLIIFGAIIGPRRDRAPQSPAKHAEKEPKVDADLSKLVIDRSRKEIDADVYSFVLTVTNHEPTGTTVYAVVYGKNDDFNPPRRMAWPAAGVMFANAGTDRGRLSPSDITRNWNKGSKDRAEVGRGLKVVLPPNGSESIDGFLPLNTTPQPAWKGQKLDPRSVYNELHLWLFSQDGKLIFNKKTNVTRK